MAQFRFPQVEELPGALNSAVQDENWDWWGGVALVALGAALAAAALPYQTRLAIPPEAAELAPGLKFAAPDEDFWAPPAPWPLASVRAFLADDERVAPPAFAPDEDGWAAPAPWRAALPAALGRADEPDWPSALVWWLDATTLALSDGDPVASWPDQSSQGHTCSQGNPAAQPTYRTAQQNGLPLVRFDGGDVLSAIGSYSYVQPSTLFVVASYEAANLGTTNIIVGGAVGAEHTLRTDASNQPALFAGTALATTETFADGCHLFSAAFAGGASQLWVDGRLVASGDAGAQAAQTFAVGAGADGSLPSRSAIGEVRFYNRLLGSTERQAVEAELRTKWFGALEEPAWIPGPLPVPRPPLVGATSDPSEFAPAPAAVEDEAWIARVGAPAAWISGVPADAGELAPLAVGRPEDEGWPPPRPWPLPVVAAWLADEELPVIPAAAALDESLWIPVPRESPWTAGIGLDVAEFAPGAVGPPAESDWLPPAPWSLAVGRLVPTDEELPVTPTAALDDTAQGVSPLSWPIGIVWAFTADDDLPVAPAALALDESAWLPPPPLRSLLLPTAFLDAAELAPGAVGAPDDELWRAPLPWPAPAPRPLIADDELPVASSAALDDGVWVPAAGPAPGPLAPAWFDAAELAPGAVGPPDADGWRPPPPWSTVQAGIAASVDDEFPAAAALDESAWLPSVLSAPWNATLIADAGELVPLAIGPPADDAWLALPVWSGGAPRMALAADDELPAVLLVLEDGAWTPPACWPLAATAVLARSDDELPTAPRALDDSTWFAPPAVPPARIVPSFAADAEFAPGAVGSPTEDAWAIPVAWPAVAWSASLLFESDGMLLTVVAVALPNIHQVEDPHASRRVPGVTTIHDVEGPGTSRRAPGAAVVRIVPTRDRED